MAHLTNNRFSYLMKGARKLAVTAEVDIATTFKNKRFVTPRLDANNSPKYHDADTDNWYLRD
jgi:hypothetical protein